MSDLYKRAEWRYVCQDCDFVTMDPNDADDHEEYNQHTHTVIRNRAFKELR